MAAVVTPEMSIGERIAAYRMYRGMTQEVCAGLVGKSLSWWKKVEQGIRHVEKLSDLILICQVLRVPELSDLTGVLAYSLSVDWQRPQPILPEVRRAMVTGPPPVAESPDVEGLRARWTRPGRSSTCICCSSPSAVRCCLG